MIIPIAGHAQTDTQEDKGPEFYQGGPVIPSSNNDLEVLREVTLSNNTGATLSFDHLTEDLYILRSILDINLIQANKDQISIIQTLNKSSSFNQDLLIMSNTKFIIFNGGTSNTRIELVSADSTGLTVLNSYRISNYSTLGTLAQIDNNRFILLVNDQQRDFRAYVFSMSGDTLSLLSQLELSTSQINQARIEPIQGNQFLIITPSYYQTISVDNSNRIVSLDRHNQRTGSVAQLEKTNTDGKALAFWRHSNTISLQTQTISVDISGNISVTPAEQYLGWFTGAGTATFDVSLTNNLSAITWQGRASDTGRFLAELSSPDYTVTAEKKKTIQHGDTAKVAIGDQVYVIGSKINSNLKISIYGNPDRNPPTLNIPNDISKKTDDPAGLTLNIGRAVAEDKEDPNPVISNNAPAKFPIGTTIVTWKAQTAQAMLQLKPKP